MRLKSSSEIRSVRVRSKKRNFFLSNIHRESHNHPSNHFRLILSHWRKSCESEGNGIIFRSILTFTRFLFLPLFSSFLRIFNLFRPVLETYPRLLSSPPSPSFPSYPETREDFAWSGCTLLLLRATDIIANEITPSCESYSTLSRCASPFRALLRDGCISVWRREREREREILSDNDAFVHYNCSKRLVLLCNYTLFDDERVSFLLLAFKCKNSECIRDLKSLWRVALANFIFPKWTYYERLRTRRRNFEKCVW